MWDYSLDNQNSETTSSDPKQQLYKSIRNPLDREYLVLVAWLIDCYVRPLCLSLVNMRHSVNRPPTPDVRDEQDKEATLLEIIRVKFIESGEKERLVELLRERLTDCGWIDKLKALCRAFIKKGGRNNVTVDDLVRLMTPKGRASIPDSVKAELLQRIRTFLVSATH